MTGPRPTAFWRAVLVVAAAWLVFEHAFPPLMPRSLLLPYLAVTVVGVLLYYASDEALWSEFKAPLRALLRDPGLAPVRGGLLMLLPLAAAYGAHLALRPAAEAPAEPRQMHPAPPAAFQAFGRRQVLAGLENPLRRDILETMARDGAAGWRAYEAAVTAGRDLYFRHCVHCHGALLDGRGHQTAGLDPRPVSFQDPAIIPQLEESYLYWRIATGGAGLPREGAPWNSAMPAWQGVLQETDVWNLLVFIFDYTGQVPRIWDAERARSVGALRDEVLRRRSTLDGPALYRFRCAACHGEQGQGDGVAADRLYPRPRDFSLGLYKYKTSPGALPPRDEDLFQAIKHGLPGTAMPGWAPLLSDAQIQSLIPVLKGFDISRAWAPEDAPDEAFDEAGRYTGTDFRVVTELEPLAGRVEHADAARGREAYLKACAQCHGDEGRGNITSGKRLVDDWGWRIWPRDLTKPWTWRSPAADDSPQAAVAAIYERIAIGIPGTPMPAHRAAEPGGADPVNEEDRWHIAHHVHGLRETSRPPRPGVPIEAVWSDGPLPDAVDDARWEAVPAASLPLAPNLIQGERLYTPLNDDVTVRVLCDEQEIVLLLELHDRTRSLPGDAYFTELMDETKGELRPDAFAIQFPRQGAYTTEPAVEKPLLGHGDAAHPVAIWRWQAGGGARRFEVAGPDGRPLPAPDAPGLLAGGEWRDGRWRILLKGPRDGGLAAGGFVPVAFAHWDGSNGEAGARHSLTGWYWLRLPSPPEPLRLYGLPAGIGLLVFALLWFTVAGRKPETDNRQPGTGGSVV